MLIPLWFWYTVVCKLYLTLQFFNFSGYTKRNKTCYIPLKSPMKWLEIVPKNLKFLTFVRFLRPFLKKWWFWTFKWMNIFEWNFQQIFLIELREQPIQNGWAWPLALFDASLANFQKCYFFKNEPKNLTKVEHFKKNFAFLVTIL